MRLNPPDSSLRNAPEPARQSLKPEVDALNLSDHAPDDLQVERHFEQVLRQETRK